jgi:hypothetical protein
VDERGQSPSSTIGHTRGMRDATNDMLLLTTRGRSSGKAHTVPLLYFAQHRTEPPG